MSSRHITPIRLRSLIMLKSMLINLMKSIVTDESSCDESYSLLASEELSMGNGWKTSYCRAYPGIYNYILCWLVYE